MPSHIIAQALYTLLLSSSEGNRADPNDRIFFRLDGFDEIYPELIDILKDNDLALAGRPLTIRTTAPIPSYADFALEQGKTATWYRNHLPPRHVLLLIFNQPTSDAQSLKDIFAVNEMLLVSDKGLPHLVRAAFHHGYQITATDDKTLRNFVERFKRTVGLPQLRDLARFLEEINALLQDGKHLGESIALSLPHLGLFRCAELSDILEDKAKVDRRLRELHQAAILGGQLLSDAERRTYLERLDRAKTKGEFEDDSPFQGKTPEQKYEALRRFLVDVITDNAARIEVLSLDWREVNRVLFKPPRPTPSERLKAIAQVLKQKIAIEDMPEYAQDILHDLDNGQMPDTEDLERLTVEEHDRLGKTIMGQLRRLVKTRSYSHTDFVAGLTVAAVNLITESQDDLSQGATLQVTFSETEMGDYDPDVLVSFRALYGGIETAFPSLKWKLDDLWRLEKEQRDPSEVDSASSETIRTATLTFHLSLCGADKTEIAQADLVWQYPPDSPAVATFRAFEKLKSEYQKSGPFIPVFNTCQPGDDITDLDLRHPIRTLGTWLDKPRNLRLLVHEALNRPAIGHDVAATVDASLANLEVQWGSLVSSALDRGLFASDVNGLLDTYEHVLKTAVQTLKSGQEVTFGFRTLTKAWIVGPEDFDDWAIVPLLHPLKLLWWRNRAVQFEKLIAKLLDPNQSSELVDIVRFRRGLTQTYGSSGFPAVIVLPDRTGQPITFLPLDEVDGYELFRPVNRAGIAQGLDPDLVSQQEAEEESAKAAESLAHVITDYIQTYPFVRDGIEVYLVGCRNGALPGQFVEQISKRQKRRDDTVPVRISVIVHTPDRGAPLFGRVIEWLKKNEQFAERPSDDYFPSVTLRVLECDYDALRSRLREQGESPNPLARDIVILPDVLSEHGQEVEEGTAEKPVADIPREDFVPFSPLYRSLLMPFQQGELERLSLLNPAPLPTIVRYFYNSHRAFLTRRAITPDQTAEFHLRYSLDHWSDLLKDLHQAFNWVVCYDGTIDRFLLEATFPNHVQVIRYSLGLGVKGHHNLTVSSSYWAQQVVIRRLTGRLQDLLPAAPEDLRLKIAERLVKEAKFVSGDIVLRAAGPGAYLNELIGVVLAKRLTERRYLEQHPDALVGWIYLDDFGHWFDGKKPDLLFLAIPVEANGELPLHTEIVEAKCVGDSSFESEAADAEHQVQRGVNRLGPAWRPGCSHLDANYWYDQLYRALVGNLSIKQGQMRLWEALRFRLPKGNFTLEMSGHSWVFCYDGPGTTVGGLPVDEGPASLTAEDAPEVSLWRHHYGRRGVVAALKSLVEDWDIHAPPETWQAVSEPEPVIAVSPPEASPVSATPPAESPIVDHPCAEVETEPVPDWLLEQAHQLDRVLRQHGINAFPIEPGVVDIGPSIIRYKIRLRPGEKDKRLQNIASDLARELALHDIPLIERLPGTRYISVDIPRVERDIIPLIPALAELPPATVGALPFLVGKTPNGQTVIKDLALLPHLLVAGTTGSGKTIFLYSLLTSLIHQFTSQQLSILLVDPKRTDFVFFRGLAYLRSGQVLCDPEEAIAQMRQLTGEELDLRTTLLNEARCVKWADYNERQPSKPLVPIVVVVDEYADLVDIMDKTERAVFEREIRRLAQRARSVGIHLIISTQRPSADIVTTSLKTNLPSRIAFRLPSHHDSMVILDQPGAENLLGRGDMLFSAEGQIERLQGFYLGTTQLEEFLHSHKPATRKRK